MFCVTRHIFHADFHSKYKLVLHFFTNWLAVKCLGFGRDDRLSLFSIHCICRIISNIAVFHQVLLTELASTWPARNLWTIDQLSLNYGDTAFRISQRSANKVLMKLGDYISYTRFQCDEDPLYIFDDKVLLPLILAIGAMGTSRASCLPECPLIFAVCGSCTRFVEGLHCSTPV